MNITTEKLKEILELHQKWLRQEEGGQRANLSNANLSYANLSNANLSNANLSYANLRYADLSTANLRYADLSTANLSTANLSTANLSYANLRCADLRGANLSTANLDFSVWPLWCGSLDVKADRRLAAQLAYHFCRIDFGKDKAARAAQRALTKLANTFHGIKTHNLPTVKGKQVKK